MRKITRAAVASALAAPLLFAAAGAATADSAYGAHGTYAGTHGAATGHVNSVAVQGHHDGHARWGHHHQHSLSAYEWGGTFAGPHGAGTLGGHSIAIR